MMIEVRLLPAHGFATAGADENGAPSYFAWGCFRDFVSRPCDAPPTSPPLCLPATPLEGWRGLRMTATNSRHRQGARDGRRGHSQGTRCKRRRAGGARGDRQRAAARDRRPWQQAAGWPADGHQCGARPVGAERGHLLRAERADHHGAGGRAARRRQVADQFQEPAIRLRSDGYRAAARHIRRSAPSAA